MHPVMPMAEPTPIGETDHCAIKADYHRNCGCGASAQVGERYVALPETGGPGELASSRGRKTSKPRMCVSRNRDQPWSYRYYEITLSCPARVRAQLAFRVGDDLGVGRPSIYTTASGRILEKCSWVRISFHYSWRRATIGSTRLARSAGMHAAASATKSRMSGAAVKVSGSDGFTPNNCALSSRVSPNAAATPKARPATVIRRA